MQILQETTPRFQTNSYLLYDEATREAVWIDPGERCPQLEQAIEEKELHLSLILLTHGHIDHIGAATDYRSRYGAPLGACRAERALLENPSWNLSAWMTGKELALSCDCWYDDGEAVGVLDLQVLHTPGHTEGSACFAREDLLFCGDLIFSGSVGRWDFPTGDVQALEASVDRILQKRHHRLFCGHGPQTDTERERALNPFSRYQLQGGKSEWKL